MLTVMSRFKIILHRRTQNVVRPVNIEALTSSAIVLYQICLIENS